MEIFKKMGDIMKEIPAIGKDRENKMQGFKFRGVEDVMNALQPIFAKHGVFTTIEVLDEKASERVTGNGRTLYHVVLRCKVSFWAEDGSSVSAIVNGEAADSGDKVHAKCLSIAFKYACFTTFAIPTEEMPDPDAWSNEPTIPKSDKTIPPKTIMATDAQKAEIIELAKNRDLTEAQRVFINGIFQIDVTPEKCAKIKASIISAPIIQTDPGIPDNDSVPDL